MFKSVMDLLSARMPKGVLFLGKCGGLKHSTEIGHFVLPIAADDVRIVDDVTNDEITKALAAISP